MVWKVSFQKSFTFFPKKESISVKCQGRGEQKSRKPNQK